MSNSTKSFEEIVRAMSAKDIIMAMVNGLKNPSTKINMCTFGATRVRDQKIVCYGCAATNTVCQISGVKFTPKNIDYTGDRARTIKSSYDFLTNFEWAINELRKGYVEGYNEYAARGKFRRIQNPNNLYLPRLHNDYTQDQLNVYKKLAKTQRK